MFIHMVSKPHYLFKKSFCPSYSICNKFNDIFLLHSVSKATLQVLILTPGSLEKLLKIKLSTS